MLVFLLWSWPYLPDGASATHGGQKVAVEARIRPADGATGKWSTGSVPPDSTGERTDPVKAPGDGHPGAGRGRRGTRVLGALREVFPSPELSGHEVAFTVGEHDLVAPNSHETTRCARRSRREDRLPPWMGCVGLRPSPGLSALRDYRSPGRCPPGWDLEASATSGSLTTRALSRMGSGQLTGARERSELGVNHEQVAGSRMTRASATGCSVLLGAADAAPRSRSPPYADRHVGAYSKRSGQYCSASSWGKGFDPLAITRRFYSNVLTPSAQKCSRSPR